jgi:hypothetical protein
MTKSLEKGFVLRSGQVVPFDEHDPSGMIDLLKAAIMADCLQLATRSGKPLTTWDPITREIVAEVTHLAETMPPLMVRGLLIDLLSTAVFEDVQAMAAALKLEDAPVPKTIQ